MKKNFPQKKGNNWKLLSYAGAVLIFLGALNYLLGWKSGYFPALSTIGIVFLAVGITKSRK